MQLRPPRSASSRNGGVAPLTVLCLTLLLGVIAAVVDGGTLMEARRHVQAAADAAALAAASDLFANYLGNQGKDPGGTAKASALSTADANGFSNDGVQSIVTINIAPANYQGGPHAGKPLPPGYVEVNRSVQRQPNLQQHLRLRHNSRSRPGCGARRVGAE